MNKPDLMIQQYFKEQVLLGEFEKANKAFETLFSDEKSEMLMKLSYESLDISFYSFLLSNLLNQETIWLHREAIILLMISLCYEGWDALGLYHSIRGIKCDPAGVEFREFALCFYEGHPDPLFTKKEGMQIIQDILEFDSNNKRALDTLEKMKKNYISDITIDENDFDKLLYYGRFEEARIHVKELTQDELFKKLKTVKPIFMSYGYIINLLFEHESAASHQLASRVLVEFPDFIKGAYSSAYWHGKRAVDLDHKNIEYKLWLLKFYELPGQLLNKDNAIEVAQEIVELEANNMQALVILNILSKNEWRKE